jgi:hypothetical protein
LTLDRHWIVAKLHSADDGDRLAPAPGAGVGASRPGAGLVPPPARAGILHRFTECAGVARLTDVSPIAPQFVLVSTVSGSFIAG